MLNNAGNNTPPHILFEDNNDSRPKIENPSYFCHNILD